MWPSYCKSVSRTPALSCSLACSVRFINAAPTGLHRLAGLGLRVVAGTNEIRVRCDDGGSRAARLDVADVLETSRHVLRREGHRRASGSARRGANKCRFGRAGCTGCSPSRSSRAAVFRGQRFIFSAKTIRSTQPRISARVEAERARDAYLGGIEIGPMIQPAKQLARGLYFGTDLTASRDGRLGRGKGVKIVEQGESTWQADAIQERFRRPLLDQWNAVYAQAGEPADARPAGWDFVFVTGTVAGTAGAELLFIPNSDTSPIRMAIENESESLCFRENLRMLSHAPGLRMQVIGRMNLQEPTIFSPLAMAQAEGVGRTDGEPCLEIPQSFAGRICLGFDELQRHHLKNAQASTCGPVGAG